MYSPAAAVRAAFLSLLSLACLLLASPTARAATTGELKTAVILVNFQDNPSQPISRTDASTLVFGQVSDFFWEASYQKTFLTGDTYGYYTLPLDSTTCDEAGIAREANAAAARAGVDLSGYGFVIYQFPYVGACFWSGANNRGDRGENLVFVNGARTFKVIAHEIGHRFGLFHSDALDCGAVTLGTSCSQQSYNDQADTMGNRGAHFNAFQKERLGWFNAAGMPSLTTVASSGRYTIEPISTATTGVKGLKILKSTDPVTGQKTWYYVEYRQPTGFDASLIEDPGNLTQGVLIHTGTVTSSAFATSLLLDMTPNSNSNDAYDMIDGALGVGRSYSDPTAGVTITLVSANAAGAVVDVNVGAAQTTCTRAAPVLTLAGPTAAVAAGSTNNYTLTVSNKDSGGCAATTFSLARSVPTGWSGALGASSLTLSAGASGTTTLAVTSPATATAGNYGVGAGASSSAGSVHTANAGSTYSVAASSLSETVSTDKTSYVRAETVAMTARVSNAGAPVAGASVRFVITLPGGASTTVSATSGSDGVARASYKTGKAKTAIGTYQLRADATGSGGSATATSSFSVR